MTRDGDRSEIERVKREHPMADVASHYVYLARAGRRYRGFCPFHDDRKSASFVVFPENNSWYCFGACGEGGDVLDFVMKAENCGFREALERLGGGQLPPLKGPPPKPIEGGVDKRVLTDVHYAVLTMATEVYHAALLANREALDYATKRGLSSGTVREFKVGYAAGRLKRYLRHRNWPEDLAQDLGLLDDKGREWFRGRLVIPELRGDPPQSIYIAGRSVPGDRLAFGPKYLFLAGASKPMYGEERVRDCDEVFIVEGPLDWLLLWQWGFPSVAVLGRYIKNAHVRALQPIRRKYIVPHRDDAGRQMWKAAKEAFGDELLTVLVPEEMKDVGDVAEQAAAPARLFKGLVDKAF